VCVFVTPRPIPSRTAPRLAPGGSSQTPGGGGGSDGPGKPPPGPPKNNIRCPTAGACAVCLTTAACQACSTAAYSLNNATGACDCAPGYAARKVNGGKNSHLKCRKCNKKSVSPGGGTGKAVCTKCAKGTVPNADGSFCVKAGEWPMASYDLTNRRWPLGEKNLSPYSIGTKSVLWTYKPDGDTSATPMVFNGRMYMPTWWVGAAPGRGPSLQRKARRGAFTFFVAIGGPPLPLPESAASWTPPLGPSQGRLRGVPRRHHWLPGVDPKD
jgi:hypothetical protein